MNAAMLAAAQRAKKMQSGQGSMAAQMQIKSVQIDEKRVRDDPPCGVAMLSLLQCT